MGLFVDSVLVLVVEVGSEVVVEVGSEVVVEVGSEVYLLVIL